MIQRASLDHWRELLINRRIDNLYESSDMILMYSDDIHRPLKYGESGKCS